MHVTTAVGQPFGARAIGANRRCAVAKYVIFVLPNSGVIRFGQSVSLVLADQLPCEVVIPVEGAALIGRLDELTIEIVGEGFCLLGLGVSVEDRPSSHPAYI